MLSRSLSVGLLAVACLASADLSAVQAQTLLGIDTTSGIHWDFTNSPGGPCFAPNPVREGCDYPISACSTVPPPLLTPAGSLWGDIADDGLRDTVFITDGRVIGEYLGDVACKPFFCEPISTFLVPPALGLAPLTGMGMDPTGGFFGTRTLWVTYGATITAFDPPAPGTCLPPSLLFGPCPVLGLPAGSVLTDLSWDPVTASLWASDSLGLVHNIAVGGGLGCPVTFSMAPSGCGLGAPLTGIAYDAATPDFLGSVPALWVTDGGVVAYVEAFTGAPAAPTFYAPSTCTFPNTPLTGLAASQRGITYGVPRVGSTMGSFGQSTTPGPSFGLEIDNAVPGASAFLLLNFSFPGPGFLCPPLPGAGTSIWVDPTGLVLALGPLPGGCTPVPLPIPPGVPTGLQLFAQAIMLVGGTPAADATNGLAATIGLP